MKNCFGFSISFLAILSSLVITTQSENLTRSSDPERLTNFNGAVAADVVNSISVGPHGPLTMLNDDFFEKIQHFFRERIPERRVAAKGNGAFGYFECTNPELPAVTKASIFSKPGKRTPLLVRFSRAASRSGSAESVRGSQNMAIKFYTDQGNWDLLTNNFPVFTIRDPIRFPDSNHAQSPSPINNLPDPETRFDFLSKAPESLHRVTWIYHDSGLPDGWQHMNTYSVNTFKFVNKEKAAIFVRFNITTLQGLKTLEDEEAAMLAGQDPNYFSSKLYDAIVTGRAPKWILQAQFMTPKQVDEAPFNPFDPTKLWPRSDYPLVPLGTIVLDDNPTNWFAQIESAAFSPGNLVPGIQPSMDKMLQARIFAYRDAHLYRLGANAHLLPINMPRSNLVQPHIRDGVCGGFYDPGPEASYFPNSLGNAYNAYKDRIQPVKVGPEELKHYNSLHDDNYSQVGQTWRYFSKEMQKKIIARLSKDLAPVDPRIQDRLIRELWKADNDYANMLAVALGRTLKLEESES